MSKSLVYYNPNVATHSTNFSLPGVERFSHFFKIYNSAVVFIDRTNTIQIPFTVESRFPLPPLIPFKKTFEEICNERAKEILVRAENMNLPLYIFYSGGIDSTLLVVSLLKNATPAQKNNLTILMSEESIIENPNFYHDHIYQKLKVDSVMSFPYIIGTNCITVGGEHNDQLFGSDIVARLIHYFGPACIHEPYNRKLIFDFFNKSLNNEAETGFYLDLFEKLKKAAPIEIVSNYDFLWWINFSLKWQSVFMRMLSFTAARNVSRISEDYIQKNYIHFYGTNDFQLWSMHNMDKKIKDTWESYKWVCKDIIYDYTKDADYRDHKLKKGSLFSVVLRQSSFNFIDNKLNFFHELDPSEYYNPQNDFI